MGKAKQKSKEAARRLLTAFYLYSGYRLDSRGPSGCIMDALKLLHPKAHKMMADGEDAADVLKRF